MANEPLRNTRRSFLAASALGALAGVATSGSAGETTATQPNPDFRVDCSVVTVDDWDTADAARAVFRDGSFVDMPRGGVDRFGAPGRVIESVTFADDDGGELTVTNDSADCDPGPKAVTFTDSRVTVREAQFPEASSTPDNLLSSVTLHFVDGTTENPVHYEGPPQEVGVADVYRGTGENEGKVVEAVTVRHDLAYAEHYIRNPAADKHLLGRETCQERCIEVMGATEGEVAYEFTVDGPVRGVTLSDPRATEGGDAVTENGDGTWTVSGSTGNPGYSDVFAINGELQSFEQTGGPGDYVLRECEWRILEDTSPSTDLLTVVATEQGEVNYEVTVDGTVRGIANVGPMLSAEDGDEVTENGDGTVTVNGFTGNEGYGDTFAVTGDVTDFTRTGGDADFTIRYNGREVSESELADQ